MPPFNVRGGEEGPDELHNHLHPVFHGGLGTQKTRMRTSFDPEMELPRLQQWFAENPHPSRHQVSKVLLVPDFRRLPHTFDLGLS